MLFIFLNEYFPKWKPVPYFLKQSASQIHPSAEQEMVVLDNIPKSTSKRKP